MIKVVVVMQPGDSYGKVIEIARRLVPKVPESRSYLLTWDAQYLPAVLQGIFDEILIAPFDASQLAIILE